MKTYVTFGQIHAHSVNGKTFDKDCVAVIESDDAESGRARAVELFGLKFFTTYFDKAPDMTYFPRGLISVDRWGQL